MLVNYHNSDCSHWANIYQKENEIFSLRDYKIITYFAFLFKTAWSQVSYIYRLRMFQSQF